MRSLVMLGAVAIAYGLLRGWPESWPAVVRACVAVLVLVAGVGIWGRRKTGSGAVAVSRRVAGWLDYGAIGAAVLAVECLFLVYFSSAPPVLENAASRLEAWLRPEAAAAREEESRTAAPRGGNWLWSDERKRPLPMRTNFKPGNRPEVFLQANEDADGEALLAGRIYVHAFGLSRYSEGAWSAHPGTEQVFRAENDGWVRLAQRPGRPVACRVFHGVGPTGQNPVTGLQGLVAVQVPELRRLDAGLHLLPPADGPGYEYETLSAPLGLDQVGEARVPSRISPELMELPAGAQGERLRELAKVAGGAGGVTDRLKRIREHLRTNFSYSLVTENPHDLDPLENFLFREKRGHCEFFATAGALLARASGVPARVCYGWAGGTYYENSRLFVFRAREAHAWTEVWLEESGWVVMDPTPAAGRAGPVAERAAAGEKPPGADELAVAEPTEPGRPVWQVALGMAALFGLPGLAMLAWRRVRPGPASGADFGGLPARGYLRGFVTGCAKRGVTSFPGATLKGMLGRLEEEPEFARELVSYHYGVCYEGRPRDEGVERNLGKRIERWTGG